MGYLLCKFEKSEIAISSIAHPGANRKKTGKRTGNTAASVV
jgi:hypothetical protein